MTPKVLSKRAISIDFWHLFGHTSNTYILYI